MKRNKRQAAWLYEEHKRLMHEQIWKHAKKSGYSIKDLEGVAEEIFMQTIDEWIKSKGAFSTILTIKLRQGLPEFTMKNEPAPTIEEGLLDRLPSTRREWRPDSHLVFKDQIQSMSQEAKEVLMVLLEGPAEALGIIGTEPAKMIRGAIMRWLRTKGWSWPKIWKAFAEIKTELAQL